MYSQPTRAELNDIISARRILRKKKRVIARNSIKSAPTHLASFVRGESIESRHDIPYTVDSQIIHDANGTGNGLSSRALLRIVERITDYLYGNGPTTFVRTDALVRSVHLSGIGRLVHLGLSPFELRVSITIAMDAGIDDDDEIKLFGRWNRYFGDFARIPIPKPGEFGVWYFKDNEERMYTRAEGTPDFAISSTANNDGMVRFVAFVRVPFWNDDERRLSGDIVRLPTPGSVVILEGNSSHYTNARTELATIEAVEPYDRVASAIVVLILHAIDD